MSDSVDENSEATFKWLHDQMYELAEQNTPDSNAEADQIANRLLTYAELPLRFRVRAYIILSCGLDNYLWHAQEAVRWVHKGIEWYGDNGSIGRLMAEAQEALRRANEDTFDPAEKLAGDAHGTDAEGDDEDDEDEGDDAPEPKGDTTAAVEDATTTDDMTATDNTRSLPKCP